MQKKETNYKKLYKEYQFQSRKDDRIDVDEQWRIMQRRVSNYSFKSRVVTFCKYAAILVVALTAIHLFKTGTQTEPAIAFQQYTSHNSKQKIVLPDNTHIYLAPNSILNVKTNFGIERIVVLERGSAFFDVAHNSELPFVVITNEIRTKVLGTKFNIDKRVDKPITVTLVSGAVEMQNSEEKKLAKLKPNQQFVYSNNKGQVKRVDANLFAAWKESFYEYKDATLSVICKHIEILYQTKITITDTKLKNEQLRFVVDGRKSLNQTLKLLKLTTLIDFRKTTDNNIEIFRKK